MESRPVGWVELSALANIWQPSRLKGIQVGPAYGTPFLGATQVFDLRPVPRKYLALARTDNSTERFVSRGTILVTCSGSVGRATIAHQSHEKVLISHDLLRVEPAQEDWRGWIYAYLHAPQTRAMMLAAQYGHIIKHLETSHLKPLPIPRVNERLRLKFQKWMEQIQDDRSRAAGLTQQAESLFEAAFPSLAFQPAALGFSVSASSIMASRQRLDAARFEPTVERVLQGFNADAAKVVTLSQVTTRVFVPGRFKHVYGTGGTPYLDSADILEVNPDIKKFVLSLSAKDQEEYRVLPGWVLIPCSGQVYGNIGHPVMATNWHVGKVLTNHIMRVCPSKEIRSGYLLCVMGHPRLGRPQTIRFAFGSSVPEIAPEDVAAEFAVPRLRPKLEDQIADLMEQAAAARDRADEIEVKIRSEAEHVLNQFLAGNREILETDASAPPVAQVIS